MIAEHDMKDLPEWKPDEVTKLFLLLFIGIFTGGVLLDPVKNMAESWGPEWVILVQPILGVLTFHGLGLVWIHLFLKFHKVQWSGIFNFHPSLPGGKGVLIGAGVGFGMILVSIFVNTISATVLSLFGKEVQSQEVVQLVQQHAEIPAALIFFFFSAVVLAPIVEEFLFRGVIFRFLCQFKLRKTAYAISALLFSVMHTNMMGFLSFILLACVFAWLLEKYQSLLVCITAHMVFNGIQFLMIVAAAYQGVEMPDSSPTTPPAPSTPLQEAMVQGWVWIQWMMDSIGGIGF